MPPMRAECRANRSAATMDVQSAADETGLPKLVVLDRFNVVWQRLAGSA